MKKGNAPPWSQTSPEAVRTQLDKILRSGPFAPSERTTRFLRFLVIHFTLVVNQAILGLAPLAAKIGAIERGLSKASGGVH